MKLSLALSTLAAFAQLTSPSRAAEPSANMRMVRACISAAAEVHRLPPSMLVILLKVEGGSLGAVSQNTNDTVDLGPMQVNQIWVPQVAAHWHATQAATYRALRDLFCANVEAGAWILRKGLDEARGDFWEGVGYYHSHNPVHKNTYLRLVLKQALALQERAAPTAARPVARPAAARPAGSAVLAARD